MTRTRVANVSRSFFKSIQTNVRVIDKPQSVLNASHSNKQKDVSKIDEFIINASVEFIINVSVDRFIA